MCGLLQKSMYGTQDAPNIWQSHYSGILIEGGYKRGKSNASVFYHPQHDVRVMVHGDDFLALGDQKHLSELEDLLRKSYELKCLGIIRRPTSGQERDPFPEQVDSVWRN